MIDVGELGDELDVYGTLNDVQTYDILYHTAGYLCEVQIFAKFAN